MNEEIKEILKDIEKGVKTGKDRNEIKVGGICYKWKDLKALLDYIINLQQENKIKDTNWESLKYYLDKLYYKDYIEEVISNDIDKKIKELESKVEIKGYQKDIKALQQENERLNNLFEYNMQTLVNTDKLYEDYKSRCEKAIEYINKNKHLSMFADCRESEEDWNYDLECSANDLLNILQGENNATNKDL